eukprot:scaffold76710_cov90-Phaeocystis_antarctica.AAC.1
MRTCGDPSSQQPPPAVHAQAGLDRDSFVFQDRRGTRLRLLCVFRLSAWPCALVRAYVSSACVGFALDGRQLTQHWGSRSGHERKLVPVVAVAG